MNLIATELSISLITMPMDLIGSLTQGDGLVSTICVTNGFLNTLFGKMFLVNYSIMIHIKLLTINILHCIEFNRYELIIHDHWYGYSEISICCSSRLHLACTNHYYFLVVALHQIDLGFIFSPFDATTFWFWNLRN